MNRVPRWLRLLLTACGLIALLAACATPTSAPSPHDTKLPILNNQMKGGEVRREHPIPADGVTLITFISTDYDSASWRITDSKTLNIGLVVKARDQAGRTEIMVEHLHADVSLTSTNQTLNGWPQDSMDSSIHSGAQPGFSIDPTHPYNVVFAIEGLSETLISGWGYATGDFGAAHISEKRLTEDHLIHDGDVTGNKIQIVWVVLLKGPNDKAFHEVSFVDELLVQVAPAG